MEAPTPSSLNKAVETPSICTQLNLDVTKLEIQQLLENTTYLRLYNIVKNDMARGEVSFRKNLIKELYFLLQITPIIRPELKDIFLEQVQMMYNIHDHKKIDLGSKKLNNLMSIVHSKKESVHEGHQRPKSGVTWNTSVPSFLRPYTASRPKQNKQKRPESSKINTQSTKVSTLADFQIRQFTTNIQEELQISKDFIQKHRTMHPEYQPVYEQLYNILKTIEAKEPQEPKPVKKGTKKIKYPKSAVTRNMEASWVRPEEDRRSQHFNTEEAQQSDLIEMKDNEGRQKSDNDESSQEEQYLYVNEDEKKPYKAYSTTVKVEEVKVQDKNRDDCLKKYSHLVKTKLVHAAREDHEIVKKYVNYARVQSGLKRQMNRRNQSKRLLSAKVSNRPNITYKTLGTVDKENEEKGLQVIDLSLDPLALPSQKIKEYPTYNRRQFLKNRYEKPVHQFKKRNIVGYVSSSEEKTEKPKRPMTSYVRFQSPERFDPLSSQNVRKYNEDVMEEIQKIKEKIGGKNYASTESLMKALAVVEVPPLSEQISWANKNPCFNMVSQGKKKLKKKGRRGVKLQKKNTPGHK